MQLQQFESQCSVVKMLVSMRGGVSTLCVLAVCSLLILSISGVGGAPEFWGPEETDPAKANKTRSESWICHMKDYSEDQAVVTRSIVNYTKCSASCNSTYSQPWLGYIGAVVAVVFFGSNFVPVKRYETGDGVFFQWVLCVGIWLVGLVVNFILDSPPFFLPAVIGGFLWTSGNMLVVPIIQMIGMTMGLTVWGVTNMLSGWVTGRFILKQDVTCNGLNIGGVVTVVLSVFILAFVKSEGKSQAGAGEPSEKSALLGDKTASLEGSLRERMCGCCINLFKLQKPAEVGSASPTSINSESDKVVFSSSLLSKGTTSSQGSTESWVDKLGTWQKRILGFGLSLVAGMVFSFLFLPVQFLKLCEDNSHSCIDLRYLFGVYSGILITSSIYMFLYAVITGNKPKVYPKVIFPGLISGILWGIAMAGWFLANQHLSMAISFPLVTAGPGFISSLWGIVVYREIKGAFNIVLFFVAFVFSLTGLIMNGLSKCTVHC